MRVVTSNIRNTPDLLRRKVKAAAERTGRLGDVLFFQEIAEPEDHKDIQHSLGPCWKIKLQNIAIPIALREDKWEIIDVGFVKTHHGKRRTSPSRFISWVIAKNKGSGKVVVFINTHFVSGAWVKRFKRNKRWRKKMWRLHWQIMDQVVSNFLDSGLTVVGGGDFNKRKVKKFHPSQRWIAQHGIDKLFVIEADGGVRVKIHETGHEDVTRVKDHSAVWARIALRG